MSHMLTVTTYRTALEKYLREYLETEKKELAHHFWASDVFDRLIPYATSGKLWRGTFCLLSFAEIFEEHNWELLLPAAAAIEVLQSAILAQDDIIDRDNLRRGKEAIHIQYQKVAAEWYGHDQVHLGESYGLCWSDVAIFLSQRVLAKVEMPPERVLAAIQFYAREFSVLALNEMLDVHQTVRATPVTIEETLTMYRYKTARYTYTAPITMAGIYAGADPKLLAELEAISEDIGLIFQIGDDTIGLFGTEEETGKPATSDAREGKRTPYYIYALELATPEQRTIIDTWYGNPKITQPELELVRQVIRESGAQAKVTELVSNLHIQIAEKISHLAVSDSAKKVLTAILEMTLARQK